MAPLWWAALAASVAYVAVVMAGRTGWIRGIKVLPALLLAGALAPTHPLAAGAMVLSAAGDAFLLDKSRFFLHGLVAFLLAHLLFVPAFLGESGTNPSPAVVVGLLLVALALVAYLRPRDSVLKLAVPVYALVLCAMVAAGTTLGSVGIAGALSFLVSDAALAIRKFRRDFPGSDIFVMTTYYGALLALSAALLA